MAELFPMFGEPTKEAELPLCKDVAWNFVGGFPVFKNGKPVIVVGAEAVRVWIYKALLTGRGRFEIYSLDFGSEIEKLIGQNYTEGTKRAEISRYIREALLVSPYITAVSATDIEFIEDRLSVFVTCDTVYGVVNMNV